MFSPLPYDARWTSKLIRRDIRDVRNKLKTRLFKNAKASSQTSQVSSGDSIAETGSLHYTFAEPSIETVSTEFLHDDSSRPSTETRKASNTLHELLDARLKATYASRDRDMSHDERWQLRGSYLVLSSAIQSCPSNPIYDIFRDDKSAMNESGLLLEVLRNTSNVCASPAGRVSQMPAAPYSRRSNDPIRYDSAFSTVSSGPKTSQAAMKPTKMSTPAHLWHAILEATTDVTKTVSITEGLLGHVLSGKDAVETLYRIGHPGKTFHDEEFAELRLKFREILFPEYNDLINACQPQTAV
ncbi:hypothetical protein P153DRAFT_294026 [Dothidotthia symphoricarpi CBS 119687]|uniref:Uncharacterized protein n=1 Tax=Dothidotthia symphoricarpi CBS 119687 TaxID=1392245 RepID=A0A6A6AAY0_9PLEO|nr:uncharacterized protein P153DRAFT_294026 [Dothidotthia symphoricarpi CBS 119687]KAF2128028.1 hypothetical protein P153DRAFT_294026 [Dothidotthia symphoricarpi CBS 119687]